MRCAYQISNVMWATSTTTSVATSYSIKISTLPIRLMLCYGTPQYTQMFLLWSFFPFSFCNFNLNVSPSMARLTLRPDNSCFFSHCHTPFIRTTSFQRFHFHPSPSNFTLRLRIAAKASKKNAKETQRVSKAKAKVLTELEVEELEKQQHGNFSGNWPPWKNLPLRYKLIGTTSLAFVICNMDKVLTCF